MNFQVYLNSVIKKNDILSSFDSERKNIKRISGRATLEKAAYLLLSTCQGPLAIRQEIISVLVCCLVIKIDRFPLLVIHRDNTNTYILTILSTESEAESS